MPEKESKSNVSHHQASEKEAKPKEHEKVAVPNGTYHSSTIAPTDSDEVTLN